MTDKGQGKGVQVNSIKGVPTEAGHCSANLNPVNLLCVYTDHMPIGTVQMPSGPPPNAQGGLYDIRIS
jgi:hypothetical protein